MSILLDKYCYRPDSVAIESAISSIAAATGTDWDSALLKRCFSIMDLTTLHTEDTDSTVRSLVAKVNSMASDWPEYPLPASVCVFPNFASVAVAERNDSELHVTTVASCFPSAQSFLEVKVRECELAVENGADEVDIVLALNSFLSGDYENARNEIRQMRKAVDSVAERLGRSVVLKVILETGLLGSYEAIAEASFLAMEEGADFIKTSTGKVSVNATPQSAYIMCECIKAFFKKTGRMVGFKAAGGISTAEEAVTYWKIAEAVLGEPWLEKKYLRFGVSRLGNALMTAAEGRQVKWF